MDSINRMRIGGLASGMDIDSIVNDMMKAERIPHTKMEQDKTWMTWQRDAFREVNTQLFDLDQMAFDMKLDSTFNSKSASSSQSDAITATADATSSSGTYSIEVKQLASSAINVSTEGISLGTEKIDPFASMADQGYNMPASIKFTTYNEYPDGKTHEITIAADDSLNDVLTKITDGDNGVRAFYDVQSDKVIMERTGTGDYNTAGAEINFAADTSGFFNDVFKMTNASEQGGDNAIFNYNGAIDLEAKSNKTTLNGITLNFTKVSDGAANITIANDVDATVDKITAFVEKYNEVISDINGRLQEEKHRDFRPLTDKQKEDLSENEIELWAEKAKSGMLKGEDMLSSGLLDMRRGWYAEIDTGNEDYNHLSEIGITTSSDYLEAGKLEINEKELRAALTEDPDDVQKLFSNDVEGAGRGVINRLEDALAGTMSKIEERAGKGTQTLEEYTLGKRMKDLDSRIESFQDRLVQIENRYWGQFTQMEKAIQRMNSQSSYLMQQFGGQ